jgi:hypothetical protein
MSDQWFYRMFGEQFGPLPLEKLKDLADSGTIQALDQVRRGSSGSWVAAATVDELELSTSERGGSLAVATLSDFDISTPQAVSDEWFCLLGDHELGPLSFDELLKYAEQEQLSADDQVKLGSGGKWRRAGSIGRLMAALPYKAHEKTIVPRPAPVEKPIKSNPKMAVVMAAAPVPTVAPAPVAIPDPEVTYRLAYEQAKAKVAESMLAQADATFKAAEDQAQGLVAWATAPNVDRFWWGWSGGVEFGPVEFTQVYGLAKSGQLKPSDFVRNGQYSQYVPASNIPGLLQAVELINRAAAARDLARSQAQAAASLAAPPSAADSAKAMKSAVMSTVSEPVAKPKSSPSIPVPTAAASNVVAAPSRPAPKSDPQIAIRTPAPVEPERVPEPAPEPSRPSYAGSMSGGFSSMGSGSSSAMSTYGMNRPAPTPVKSYPKKRVSDSTWFSDMLEHLKEPKAIGSACVIALVALVFGWGYLPKSRGADIKRYQVLTQLLQEAQSKRSSPAELTAIQNKMTKVGKEMAAELKDKASPYEPAKQCLLWASRDEIPRMVAAGLATESIHEKNFAAKLNEAAIELGLKPRPPVDLAALAARANED